MSEPIAIHALWGKAKDHPDYIKAEWIALQRQVEQQEAELARLRADAERWRWLANHARWSGFRDCEVTVNADLWTIAGSKGRKTKTIADCVDAAIAAEKAK